MKNWKVNILTVKLFSVAAKDRVSSMGETPHVRLRWRLRSQFPHWDGGSITKTLVSKDCKSFVPISQSFMATILLICRDTDKISHRGHRQEDSEKLAPLSAYPGHDSDDEVMQDGPQHHRSSVGVVA